MDKVMTTMITVCVCGSGQFTCMRGVFIVYLQVIYAVLFIVGEINIMVSLRNGFI